MQLLPKMFFSFFQKQFFITSHFQLKFEISIYHLEVKFCIRKFLNILQILYKRDTIGNPISFSFTCGGPSAQVITHTLGKSKLALRLVMKKKTVDGDFFCIIFGVQPPQDEAI